MEWLLLEELELELELEPELLELELLELELLELELLELELLELDLARGLLLNKFCKIEKSIPGVDPAGCFFPLCRMAKSC